MTVSWHFTTHDPRVSIPHDAVTRWVRDMVAWVPPRFSLRATDHGDWTDYEPYADGQPMSQTHRRGRGDLHGLFEATTLSLMSTGGVVGFCQHAHVHGRLAAKLEREVPPRSLTRILEMVLEGRLGWWEVTLGDVRFRYGDVAVRSFGPNIDQPSGPREIEVVAASVKAADAELRRVLAAEGAWAAELPVPTAVSVERRPT